MSSCSCSRLRAASSSAFFCLSKALYCCAICSSIDMSSCSCSRLRAASSSAFFCLSCWSNLARAWGLPREAAARGSALVWSRACHAPCPSVLPIIRACAPAFDTCVLSLLCPAAPLRVQGSASSSSSTRPTPGARRAPRRVLAGARPAGASGSWVALLPSGVDGIAPGTGGSVMAAA